MGKKRFYTDYPIEGSGDCRWRSVWPRAYDGDKYVRLADGQEIKLGYLHHGRPYGPRVTHRYAERFIPRVRVAALATPSPEPAGDRS